MNFDYLLDANTYIQAKNFYYRMHVVPGFWEWLDLQLDGGSVGSVLPVLEELTAGRDELADWASGRKSRMLRVDDEPTQRIYADIVNHVMSHPVYEEPNTSTFVGGADPWLIAKAVADEAEVITQEVKVPPDSKKIKVPNVCEEFGVAYRNAYDLLDALAARLVLDR